MLQCVCWQGEWKGHWCMCVRLMMVFKVVAVSQRGYICVKRGYSLYRSAALRTAVTQKEKVFPFPQSQMWHLREGWKLESKKKRNRSLSCPPGSADTKEWVCGDKRKFLVLHLHTWGLCSRAAQCVQEILRFNITQKHLSAISHIHLRNVGYVIYLRCAIKIYCYQSRGKIYRCVYRIVTQLCFLSQALWLYQSQAGPRWGEDAIPTWTR